uniref:Poly(A) binding protein interacting protein 2B n=1 Tax=Rattus norvegicus TaxID=10116 RepID=A0ABK0LLW1_RAT
MTTLNTGSARISIMNGSSVASTSPSVKCKEDQGLNGHEEKENPFAEYMWMENEEDFNRQVEEELQEQDFLDRCFQEMLDEEDQDWFIPARDLPQAVGHLQQQLNGLSVGDSHESEDILSMAGMTYGKYIRGKKQISNNRVADKPPSCSPYICGN